MKYITLTSDLCAGKQVIIFSTAFDHDTIWKAVAKTVTNPSLQSAGKFLMASDGSILTYGRKSLAVNLRGYVNPAPGDDLLIQQSLNESQL